MTKKEYMKPTLKVFNVQKRSRILAGSSTIPYTSVRTSGLDTENDLLYDENNGSGNQGYAW